MNACVNCIFNVFFAKYILFICSSVYDDSVLLCLLNIAQPLWFELLSATLLLTCEITFPPCRRAKNVFLTCALKTPSNALALWS